MSNPKSHFKKVDPILYKVLLEIEEIEERFPKETEEELFEDLVESIVSQQLSVKAADTIFFRIKDLLTGGKIIPENVLKLKEKQLREVGLSNSKVKYVRDLAEKVKSKELDLESLNGLSDEEVIEELIKVKGIGRWTGEMFLMFSLGREDVFSAGDLGLKNAIKRIYNLESPTGEELRKIAEKWSPFRTYACRVLWRSLRNN